MGMAMKEDETRRKIIEGAKKLFQLYGFTRITIDEIAVNLKMSKKTMYKHFKSKDDLIWGVILSIQQPFVGRIQAAIESDKDFHEILLEIFSLFQQLSLQVTPPMIEDMHSMPHIWEKIDALRRAAISENFEKVIVRGQANGVIRQDLDVKFMTNLWLHVVSSMLTPQTMMQLNMTPKDFFEKLLSFLMTGILTEEGRKRLGGST
jgi:AcrR family transcriptional regulator